MIKKALLIIVDGLGDRPIKEFGYKTPLEVAKTPNLDALAKKSQCGLMYSLGIGKRPGSDTSHLEILGYPIDKCYSGRGPIEVLGIGETLQDGDIAFRGNFGTVDKEWNVIDRRAGRINEVSIFTKAIDGMEIEGIKFIVKPGTAYRAGLILRGKGLSANVTDADSHISGDKVHEIFPKDNTKEAKFTARVLNEFMKRSYNILKDLEENKTRRLNNKLEANFLLFRGPGQYKEVENFNNKYAFKNSGCIAGGGLYKGIGKFVGMQLINVNGATGLPNTNISKKIKEAVKRLNNNMNDFIFLHIKATDSLAEDGNFLGKRDFIEKIDKEIEILNELDEETMVVITADHSTSSELKTHTADPVLIMIYGEGQRYDDVEHFSEKECAKGSIGIIEGKNVMLMILNIMGKLHLIGA